MRKYVHKFSFVDSIVYNHSANHVYFFVENGSLFSFAHPSSECFAEDAIASFFWPSPHSAVQRGGGPKNEDLVNREVTQSTSEKKV
jgi:hypothetical protein